MTINTTEAMPVVSIQSNRFPAFSTYCGEEEFDLSSGVSEQGQEKVFLIFLTSNFAILSCRSSKQMTLLQS